MNTFRLKMAISQSAEERLAELNLTLARAGVLKLVGRSLSFCVSDIMHGRIRKSWVSRIVAGTKAVDFESWERLLKAYSTTYWRDNPRRGMEIANYFRSNGMFEQPRASGEVVHYIGDGHWIGLFGKPFRLPRD